LKVKHGSCKQPTISHRLTLAACYFNFQTSMLQTWGPFLLVFDINNHKNWHQLWKFEQGSCILHIVPPWLNNWRINSPFVGPSEHTFGLKQDGYLCNYVLGQSDGWIFCVSLAKRTCTVLHNVLSRICWSTGSHFKRYVYTVINMVNDIQKFDQFWLVKMTCVMT